MASSFLIGFKWARDIEVMLKISKPNTGNKRPKSWLTDDSTEPVLQLENIEIYKKLFSLCCSPNQLIQNSKLNFIHNNGDI